MFSFRWSIRAITASTTGVCTARARFGMQLGAILAPTPTVVDEQLCKALQPFAACYDETEWNQRVAVNCWLMRCSRTGRQATRGLPAADGSGPVAPLSVVSGDDCAKDGASATMMDASATHRTMIQATFAGSIT